MGSYHRITRRTLLRCGSRTLIAITAATLFATPHAGTSADSGTHRLSWEQHDLPLTDQPLLSPSLDCTFLFNAIESRWDADVPDGASLDLSLRARDDATDWGDWIPLHADDHAPDDADIAAFGDLVIVAPSTH